MPLCEVRTRKVCAEGVRSLVWQVLGKEILDVEPLLMRAPSPEIAKRVNQPKGVRNDSSPGKKR